MGDIEDLWLEEAFQKTVEENKYLFMINERKVELCMNCHKTESKCTCDNFNVVLL